MNAPPPTPDWKHQHDAERFLELSTQAEPGNGSYWVGSSIAHSLIAITALLRDIRAELRKAHR